MSNTSKGRGIKGSKYWMQTIVEKKEYRTELDQMIGDTLTWISPLAGENGTYDEYELQHKIVLKELGITKEKAQEYFSFWPKRQPQWDGIAISKDTKTLYIVEAKAHLRELNSKLSASNEDSIRQITDSMKNVQIEKYEKGDFSKWINGYYQLANRLTFLYNLNKMTFPVIKKAKLVLLNIAEDHTYVPVSINEWEQHYKDVMMDMIGQENAPDDVILLFYSVKEKE